MTARSRHALLVAAVALVGLGFAVGLAILASNLTTQHLGLAGESPAEGTQLVSPGREERAPPRAKASPHGRSTPAATKTSSAAPAPAAQPQGGGAKPDDTGEGSGGDD